MPEAKAFIDTNVLLYLLSAAAAKADRAETVVRNESLISVQVLNELTSVARRKQRGQGEYLGIGSPGQEKTIDRESIQGVFRNGQEGRYREDRMALRAPPPATHAALPARCRALSPIP